MFVCHVIYYRICLEFRLEICLAEKISKKPWSTEICIRPNSWRSACQNIQVNLNGLRPFNQWELLDCNGHGPSTLCVKQWSGRFLGIMTGWDTSVCKSYRLHVAIIRFSFIKLGYILYISLKYPVIFLQSCTSTGFFLKLNRFICN